MAPGVNGQFVPEWQNTPLVPLDDFGNALHHVELAELRVIERCLRGVAETKSTHHGIDGPRATARQAHLRQSNLSHRKPARHQVLAVENDLVDRLALGRIPASSEA